MTSRCLQNSFGLGLSVPEVFPTFRRQAHGEFQGAYGAGIDGVADAANLGAAVFGHRVLNDAIQAAQLAAAAAGKIYALTRSDGLYVLAGSGKFENLAHLDFDDDSVFNASPAISNGRIYIRSNAYLYCLGKK